MQGTDLTAAYVDCDQYNTETRAARTMAFEVRNPLENSHVPKRRVRPAAISQLSRSVTRPITPTLPMSVLPQVFQDDPIIFPPYDANQLQAILERRSDAFKDGVLGAV